MSEINITALTEFIEELQQGVQYIVQNERYVFSATLDENGYPTINQ